MLVIVGTRTDAHSLKSQVGIGSKSDCLLGHLEKILRISDSEACMKKEKSGGVVGEQGECGDDVVGLLERDRQRLDIFSVKKEVKLLVREIPRKGKKEEYLYSAIYTMHSLKALRHGSHSFTCKLHTPCLSFFRKHSPDEATTD